MLKTQVFDRPGKHRISRWHRHDLTVIAGIAASLLLAVLICASLTACGATVHTRQAATDRATPASRPARTMPACSSLIGFPVDNAVDVSTDQARCDYHGQPVTSEYYDTCPDGSRLYGVWTAKSGPVFAGVDKPGAVLAVFPFAQFESDPSYVRTVTGCA